MGQPTTYGPTTHQRVLATSAIVVARVAEPDLDLPTPCAGWDVRRLLAHMIGQNHGFAAAAGGAGPDVALFADREPGPDHVADYEASARRVADAFAAVDPASAVWLAEISTTQSFPAPVATSFHLIDYVAHAWDVARAIGATVEFDDDVLAEAVRVAESLPDSPSRATGDAAFRPRLPVSADTPPLDRFLRLLGRDPGWPQLG